MRVNLSISADPAVTFLQKVRKQAYASEDNNVKDMFRKIPADKADECNMVIYGKRMQAIAASVVCGLAIEDPVTGLCLGAVDATTGNQVPTHLVRKMLPESIEVRGATLGPNFAVLLRLPLDRL